MPTPISQSLVTVSAAFARTASGIGVRYSIDNTGKTAILVFNRLWSIDDGQLVPDPHTVYRFFSAGKLNLLLGASPPPTMMLPTYRNEPEVTRVESGGTLAGSLALSTPTGEHNCYFDETDPATSPDQAEAIELFVEYVESPGIKTKVSTLAADALRIDTPGAFEKRQLIRSGPTALSIDVLKRTDDFARLDSR